MFKEMDGREWVMIKHLLESSAQEAKCIFPN